MTLILEDGSGVAGANALVDAAYVTAYLTARGRVAEGSWSSNAATQDAACIAATDHVETKIRQRIRGSKLWRDISQAKATLTLTAQPTATETVTIGTQTYTFQSALASADDVLIGATISITIDNLINAIMASVAGAGVTHHASTTVNADATATAFDGDRMLVYAKVAGTGGNGVATTETLAAGSFNFVALTGGSDVAYPQPLSVPRQGLHDRDGILVRGVPERIKHATAEYAVRARPLLATTGLVPDPELDDRGGDIIRFVDKTGPLTTDITYSPGTAGVGRIPAYPAADRLLSEFLRSRGVIR